MISLLLLNHFYPAVSYRRVWKKKRATNYCIYTVRSLVMVREPVASARGWNAKFEENISSLTSESMKPSQTSFSLHPRDAKFLKPDKFWGLVNMRIKLLHLYNRTFNRTSLAHFYRELKLLSKLRFNNKYTSLSRYIYWFIILNLHKKMWRL